MINSARSLLPCVKTSFHRCLIIFSIVRSEIKGMTSTMSEKEKIVIIPESDPESEWLRGKFIILRLLNRLSKVD